MRDQGRAIILALYTYIGDAVLPALKTLKPVQVTELEEAWASIQPGTTVPPRKLRSIAAKVRTLGRS